MGRGHAALRQDGLQFGRRQVVHVQLEEAVAEGAAEDLAPAVQAERRIGATVPFSTQKIG